MLHDPAGEGFLSMSGWNRWLAIEFQMISQCAGIQNESRVHITLVKLSGVQGFDHITEEACSEVTPTRDHRGGTRTDSKQEKSQVTSLASQGQSR